MNNQPSKKPLVVLAVIAVCLIIGLILFSKFLLQTTPVTIVLPVPDTANLAVTIDGKLEKYDLPSSVYPLHSGNHTIKVSKTGYTSYSTRLKVSRGMAVTLSPDLKRTSTPQLVTLHSAQPAAETTDLGEWKLTATQYFANHDWSLGMADSTAGANSAIFILRYDDAAAKWQVIDGPNTIFSSTLLSKYPSDLSNYLQTNNYVSEDSDE